MSKKIKGIVAVAVTAVILAGTLFACSRKGDTPKSTDSSLTTSIAKEEQSSKTSKSDKSDKTSKTNKSDKSDKTDESDKEKETSNEVKESSTKPENQSGKIDKSDKSDKSDKKPENKKPKQTKSQKETKRNNVTQGTTKRQTQNTTQKQTQGTTKRQTQSTTKRQTQSTTRSTTARPADRVEYKTETKDYSISYRTVDNYSNTGAESRVYQQGKNGTGRKTYKVKYVNGVRQGAELVSDTVVTQAQDHIIERYIQIEAGGTKRVPKKYVKEYPVYKDFWFSNCTVSATGENRTEWFDSAVGAQQHHMSLPSDKNAECVVANWGGPQERQVGTEIREFEDWEEIEVPAKFEWKH